MKNHSLLTELYVSALPPVRHRPLPTMPTRLYSYVYRVSASQQVRLCLLTVLTFPLNLVPLELQRRIVNDAVEGAQLHLLAVLGLIYLAAVVVHGGMKYLRNIYQDRIGEGVTRLLRRRMADSEAFGSESDEGTRQAIISAEAERVGGFVSESIGFPLLQIGIVLSVAGYMLIVEPLVAVVALCFLVPSVLVVAWLQPVLNRLSEKKTVTVRELAERVLGEAEGGRSAGDGDPDRLIQRIYRLRIRFSMIKHAMKFLNNVLGHLGPLSVLLVGGWLAVQGETQVGTIVAFLSGYERMNAPARELFNFYRRLALMRVQYGLVRQAGEGDLG